jgi:branched-chain amino acid transport system ATP-binding protein
VPEGRRIFGRLTVLENLEMGAYARPNRQEIAESLDRVFSPFPRLRERASQVAGTLSAYMALGIAQRRFVLQTGSITLAGWAADLQANDEVKRAYLGEEAEPLR